MPAAQEMLNSKATRHKILIPALICLALAILTVIAFWSLKDCGFINFDDPLYVYENTYVQSGLNANSIKQAFSSELAKVGHWHPLTWLSLMLDYQIFGLNPQGFHLVNLLFHVLNTLLLFLVLRRMTKTLWPSAFVAVLFAIHPLHVESVAWITERKDVLSTFFWMLTMGAYSYYVEHPGFRRYSLVLLFFALGLMAKPMLVTLPFVLLLLDYWPLHRFQAIKPNQKIQPEALKSLISDKQKKKSKKKNTVAVKETLEVKKPADPEYKWSSIYPLIREKVPLFVLVILSIIVTYIAAQSGGAVHSEKIPLDVRIGNAFISYIAYIGKMIWPDNLAVFYPYPYPKLFIAWQVVGSVFLLIAITLAVIWRGKQYPYLAVGWLWYAGTLLPVIGIVQAGTQAMADRYTYIPLTGLFIIVAWGVPDLLKKWKYRKEVLLILSAFSIVCLSMITWTQVGYWKNSIDLFSHTLRVTKNNYLANHNRGEAYAKLGQYQLAIEDYSEAIRLKADAEATYHDRGASYFKQGQYQLSLEDFNKAIDLNPDNVKAYRNRGIVYIKMSLYQKALEDLNEAIRLNSDDAETYHNRGIVYIMMGNYQKALEDFNEAIRLNSDDANAYNSRAFIYLNRGDNIIGCRDAQKACELGNCKTLETATGKGFCR